jgi:hypothetical protein
MGRSLMAVDPRFVVAGLQIFGGILRRKGVPRDPVTGTIDLVNQRVVVDPWTYRGKSPHPKHMLNAFREWGRRKTQAALTSYLRGGELKLPRSRVNRPILDAIDAEKLMRLRPTTPIEGVGYGSSTPAMQALRGSLFGARRRPAARRRKRRAAAPRRARRRAPARARVRRSGPSGRRRSGRTRLVKGSAAAKAWGRKMRRLRRR